MLVPIRHCMKVTQVGVESNGTMPFKSLPTCARTSKRANRGCQARRMQLDLRRLFEPHALLWGFRLW